MVHDHTDAFCADVPLMWHSWHTGACFLLLTCTLNKRLLIGALINRPAATCCETALACYQRVRLHPFPRGSELRFLAVGCGEAPHALLILESVWESLRALPPLPGVRHVSATGRNIHALDPYRMPGAAALQRGAAVAESILESHKASNDGTLPQTVSVNLWGLDAIKTKASTGKLDVCSASAWHTAG